MGRREGGEGGREGVWEGESMEGKEGERVGSIHYVNDIRYK